jgi:hypothetical protein
MANLVNNLKRAAVIRFSVRNRKRKVSLISAFMTENHVKDVIFVGCSAGTNPNELVVENAVASRANVIVACDITPCENLPWPFMQADGRDLPFASQHTDMILANAVIEHVGDLADQARFVAEQTRVARCWVITTPNRRFPVESHTSAVLRHWSRGWRDTRPEFTRLLTLSEFRDLLPDSAVIHGRPWSATFTAFYVGV